MREIKFRFWHKQLKAYTVDLHYSPILSKGMIKSDLHIIEQFTGLQDKNGKDIYEGDIIKFTALSNDHNQKGAWDISPIEFFSGNTVLQITKIPLFPFCIDHIIEIIGTIHDKDIS